MREIRWQSCCCFTDTKLWPWQRKVSGKKSLWKQMKWKRSKNRLLRKSPPRKKNWHFDVETWSNEAVFFLFEATDSCHFYVPMGWFLFYYLCIFFQLSRCFRPLCRHWSIARGPAMETVSQTGKIFFIILFKNFYPIFSVSKQVLSAQIRTITYLDDHINF